MDQDNNQQRPAKQLTNQLDLKIHHPDVAQYNQRAQQHLELMHHQQQDVRMKRHPELQPYVPSDRFVTFSYTNHTTNINNNTNPTGASHHFTKSPSNYCGTKQQLYNNNRYGNDSKPSSLASGQQRRYVSMTRLNQLAQPKKRLTSASNTSTSTTTTAPLSSNSSTRSINLSAGSARKPNLNTTTTNKSANSNNTKSSTTKPSIAKQQQQQQPQRESVSRQSQPVSVPRKASLKAELKSSEDNLQLENKLSEKSNREEEDQRCRAQEAKRDESLRETENFEQHKQREGLRPEEQEEESFRRLTLEEELLEKERVEQKERERKLRIERELREKARLEQEQEERRLREEEERRERERLEAIERQERDQIVENILSTVRVTSHQSSIS